MPFPEVNDPDNDTYSINCNLGETLPFTTVNTTGLFFKPTYSGNFSITITLKDSNVYSMSKAYSLQIAVIPLPIIMKNDTAPSKKPQAIGI